MAFSRRHIDDIYIEQEKIPGIEPTTLRKLTKLKPWRSFLAIALDWSVIVVCIVACETISYWLYPMAFVIIGTRFHALEAMMHEATHFRLHPNKTINEVTGELAVWPLGLSVFLYRYLRHFSHHKNIGTPKDPHVFQSYRKRPDLFRVPFTPLRLLKNCLVAACQFPRELWLGQIYSCVNLLPAISRKVAILWIGLQLVALWIIIAASLVWGLKAVTIYGMFFVLPFVWVAIFSRYLRLLSEHFGIPSAQQNAVAGAGTRTVLVSWPVRVILWPHHLNYHIEHHWYPSVPFYNLPALHKVLYDSPEIRRKMHVTIGLKNLIGELISSEKN